MVHEWGRVATRHWLAAYPPTVDALYLPDRDGVYQSRGLQWAAGCGPGPSVAEEKQRVETHHDRALADFNAHIQRHKFQFVTDAQADLMRAKDWWAQDKEMWRGGAERGRTFRTRLPLLNNGDRNAARVLDDGALGNVWMR